MILVTGATGTVGREVVRELRAAGEPVRALVRNPDKAAELAKQGAELARGDLGDVPSLDAAMKGVTRLFLLSSGDERQVALQGYAIQAARRAGLAQVVKLSVVGAAPDSPINLLRWHAATERELESSGLGFTLLRPGFFMQNLLGNAQSIKAQGVFYGAQGEGRSAMIDTRDISQAAAAVLRKPGPHLGKAYLLTGGEAHSLGEVAGQLGQLLGKPVKYVDVGPEALQKNLLGLGMPYWLASDLTNLARWGASGNASATSDSVRHLLGRAPRGLADFLKEHLGAFR
jgi:uncharacterized protein YbjT (DUF2867 family)